MRNALRCCISCILPCGPLDVIRIVHVNGRVEELSGTVKAAEIMKLHPKHVLKKPSSPPPDDDHGGGGGCPQIIVLPPDAHLQRGKIYFLIPAPEQEKSRLKRRRRRSSPEVAAAAAKSKSNRNCSGSCKDIIAAAAAVANSNVVVSSSDKYLSEITSEKLSAPKDRRRGRVRVWRPNLQSISETP